MKAIKKKNKKNDTNEIIEDLTKENDEINNEIKYQIIEESKEEIVEDEIIIGYEDEEKTICRILVAKPSYFVVLKNDKEILVTKKNNYKRGEDILF